MLISNNLFNKFIALTAWTVTIVHSGKVDGNPFLYGCTSDDDCSFGDGCMESLQYNSSYWYCACDFCLEPCGGNKACCTDICTNSVCATTGGTQGTVCQPGGSACYPYHSCADGFYCQPWGTVGYCNINPPTTSSIYHSSTSVSKTFDCTDKPDGDYSDPNNPCTETYYTCANGYTYYQQCPTNLYFNQQLDECVEKNNVPACMSQ